ncbi:MAG: transporter substrate-binding domain-containing protein [Humidesulfovibrio sp.]|uniref:substrate-binding periplasmic protein n=1 Tax=Humidesulfovibrio sp. TaxID=2910988 RepID=UPI0027E6370E|nr:transporter substrate-binding domain-containing protein [Humidesulfovibrio sp.]MDQ7835680.1 transporter substrate-binding domain-containing protein [Humidesulfovibrio sp.]
MAFSCGLYPRTGFSDAAGPVRFIARARFLSARLAVGACVAALLLLTGCGRAEASEAKGGATPLKVGTFVLPPWGWVDQDGSPHGIIYELHQNIAERTGLPFTHGMYPFVRLSEMLRYGELDFISGQPHKSLLEAGEKLVLLHTINIIAVTKKGSGIQTLRDLKGKTVVYQRVASYPQLEGLPGNIVRVDSYEQSIQILHARSGVDAAVFSEPSFYYFMRMLGLKRADFGDIVTIERNREDWVFVRRGLPATVRAALKTAVEGATRDGVYEKLLLKYCGVIEK